MDRIEEAIAQISGERYAADGDADIWANPEDTVVPEDLPTPAKWHITVMPVEPPKKSKGGIVLAGVTREAEAHLQIIGKIVAIGPLAFRSWKFAADWRDYLRILFGRPVSWAPKVGDWIVYGRYVGQRSEFRGKRFIVMNDDEFNAIARSPEGFRIYV